MTRRSPIFMHLTRFTGSRRTSPRRRGAVLVVALIVTTVLAGMVLTLGHSMRVELQTAGNQVAAAQAQAIERGGEQYVLGLLNYAASQGSFVQDLSDDQFQIHLGDQGTGGFFQIIRPEYDDDSLPLFGLVEESAKININTASRSQLDNLLENDEDTVDAILAWRDPNGTGDSSYQSLPIAYQCKQAPFESVEELLMVRGFNREMLYGNGTAPPIGQRGNILANSSGGMVLSDAQIARGIYDLLTIWGQEPTTAPDGGSLFRVDRFGQLSQLLSQISSSRASDIMGKFSRNNMPQNLLDLQSRGGMSADEVDQIADYARAPTGSSGRVEVNQAPPAVLYSLVGLNGIQTNDIDALLAARQAQAPRAGTIGWVAEAVGPAAAARLGRYLTHRCATYSADIHAFTDDGRGFKRFRIVIDMSSGVPQVVYRRDITDRPDPYDQQMIASLRSGQGSNIANRGAFSSGGGIQ